MIKALRDKLYAPALVWALFLVLAFPFEALAEPLKARGAILLNLDSGEILYEQDPDRAVPPASLTKILSMYVAFDAVTSGRVSLDDEVVVSAEAAAIGGSRMGLKPGEVVTLDKLLLGMAVASGNDASYAVAEHVAGSTDAFIALMNAKAGRVGMGRSHFTTVNGLPAENQMTSARDMLELSRNYLSIYPDSLNYHSTKQMIHNNQARTNANPLLGKFEGADGLKTGWTIASGYNIVTTARQGETRLLAVLLGASSGQVRAKEIDRLMQAGFAVSQGNATSVAEVLGVIPQETFAAK